MALLQPHQIRALLEHVTAHAPALLATCRWLLVDPRLARLILGDDARPPAAADLARFLRLLSDAPHEAAVAGHALLVARSRLAAELDLALERLLAAAEDDWAHPTEILGRPCPGFAEMHAASLDRLEACNGDRGRLESVRDKLARAARLEASARRRLTSPLGKRGVRWISTPQRPRDNWTMVRLTLTCTTMVSPRYVEQHHATPPRAKSVARSSDSCRSTTRREFT